MSKGKVFIIAFLLVLVGIESALFLADFMSKRLLLSPQKCLTKPDGYQGSWPCLVPYFQNVAKAVSPEAAMAEAKSFMDKKLVNDCHLFAHYIGEAALENYDFDTAQAFSSCSNECAWGCWHGVMERYTRKEADPLKAISGMQNVCEGVGNDPGLAPEERLKLKGECFHGIGHGLGAHNSLAFQDVADVCKSFGSRSHGATSCFAGLSMERAEQLLFPGFLDANLQEMQEMLPEVCGPFEFVEHDIKNIDSLMNLCMFYLTGELLGYTGYDIERTAEMCEWLQEKDHINLCRDYIPAVVSKYEPSRINVSEVLKILEARDTGE